mmetsp:Transcript_6453/g.19567  ORF Transcript_6453/g.19567 Transcript_6453/m.19567 type:complete len:90 (+) Transcript_6453:259-528(+)
MPRARRRAHSRKVSVMAERVIPTVSRCSTEQTLPHDDTKHEPSAVEQLLGRDDQQEAKVQHLKEGQEPQALDLDYADRGAGYEDANLIE